MMTELWSLSCDADRPTQAGWGANVEEHMDRSIAVSLSRVTCWVVRHREKNRLIRSPFLAPSTTPGSVLSQPHIFRGTVDGNW